jgi:thymidylate kinase
MSIKSIAFDGMHRSWKWTQIEMIKKRFIEEWIHCLTVRWEYYRHWSWKNILEDPFSLWRQENTFNTNYEEKSNRLNRELFILYKKKYPEFLKNNNISRWIIIQDRSIVGKYLFNNSEWIIDKNIDTFKKSNNIIEEKIIPDLIFILQPTKEELSRRLEKWFKKDEDEAILRYNYKKEYISQKYEKYYWWYDFIPDNIKKNITVLQWNISHEKIHEIVWNKIKKNILDDNHSISDLP